MYISCTREMGLWSFFDFGTIAAVNANMYDGYHMPEFLGDTQMWIVLCGVIFIPNGSTY